MLKISDLSFKFTSKDIGGCHNINLELRSGLMHAILGLSGSGKTTLLKLIKGDLKPQTGKIKFVGHVSELAHEFIDHNLTVEDFFLNAITLDVSQEQKIQLSRDLVTKLEIESKLKKNIYSLSQGQKERVLIGASLINRPQILLLDEPFTHLDHYTREPIVELLKTLIKDQNLICLWVTHHRDDAFKLSDTLTLLHYGEILQHGSAAEVLKKPVSSFACDILGYKNYFLITKEKDQLHSPWGPIPLTMTCHKNQALGILPAQAISISSEGVYQGEISHFYRNTHGFKVEFQSEGIKLVSCMPLDFDLNGQKTLKFNILWKHLILSESL